MSTSGRLFIFLPTAGNLLRPHEFIYKGLDISGVRAFQEVVEDKLLGGTPGQRTWSSSGVVQSSCGIKLN